MEIQIKSIQLDKPTNNGYVYDKEMFEKQLDKFNKNQIENYRQIYPRNTPVCSLGEISHKVKNAFVDEDNTVVTNIQILDTPKGQMPKQMIENNCNVSIVPVGIGNINEDGVITDYELFGFDVIKN